MGSKLPLYTSKEAKEILREFVGLQWNKSEIAKRLGRSRGVIDQAFVQHGIRQGFRSQQKNSSYSYSGTAGKIARKYFLTSWESHEEGRRLKGECLAKLNEQLRKDGLRPVTWHAICEHMRRKYGLVWPRQQKKHEEKREEKQEERLKKLIKHGGLVSPRGRKLVDVYRTFRGKLKRKDVPEFSASLEKFKDKVLELIWTKPTLTALEGIVKYSVPLEKFRESYPNIPAEIVEEKVRWLRGVSNVIHSPIKFLQGVGRLDSEGLKIKEVSLPRTSMANPYRFGVNDRSWTMAVVNGPNVGIEHTSLIQYNAVRCALADARRHGDKVLILANAIDWKYTQGASYLQVYRAKVSGLNTNIAILDPDYQAEARRIMETLPEDEMIYETAAEQFENILSGWAKICRQPDGSPEFPGPVLLFLGAKEEELIAEAAARKFNYLTKLKQLQLMAEIQTKKNALADALAEAEEGGSEREVERLGEELKKLVKQHARSRVSNVRKEDRNRYREQMRSLVIKGFEGVIPNCKVVGTGMTNFVKVGDETIMVFIPPHTNVTDMLLTDFTSHYGPKVLKGNFPKTVVICHPHSPNLRWTKREVDADGKRGFAANVYVAPIIIDDDFLREKLEDSIRNPHPLAKAIFRGDFRSGILRLNCTNGIVNHDDVSRELLIATEKKVLVSKNRPLADKKYNWRTKYIWTYHPTDPHWGWFHKEFLWDGDRKLGMCEAAIEMMRRSGLCVGVKLPVHLMVVNDDPTQGNHFQIQQQPHPQKMPYVMIERLLAEKIEDMKHVGAVRRLKIAQDIRGLTLRQFLVRGETWTQDQMEELFERHLAPNLDFFSSLLLRAEKAGLVVKGVSAFEEVDYDARDIGLVNYGSGNHFAKTVNKELAEGPIYARVLRNMLQSIPVWRGKEELLKKLVRGPLYSNKFIGWGTIQAPGGYEWGLEFRDAPPKLARTDWGDTLLAAVRIDERRGNYPRIFSGRVTMKTYGDKHFYGAVSTSHTLYFMGAPGTPTELFGELGFPPNNTGVLFVGLPIDGPDGGPVLVRALDYCSMRDYFEKPYEFDWDEFLPNPV